MKRRTFTGGLFSEDRRRTRPVPSEPARARVAENGRDGLRARILKLLLRSNIQAAVTDSKTVQTSGGKRQLVYPAGWPDVTASIPLTGRAWAIEIKTDEGEFRPEQEVKLLELEASGWLVTRAVGEQGVIDVGSEIKRQLAALDRRAFEQYLLELRRIRSEAARVAQEREDARLARASKKNSPPKPVTDKSITSESAAPHPPRRPNG